MGNSNFLNFCSLNTIDNTNQQNLGTNMNILNKFCCCYCSKNSNNEAYQEDLSTN